MKYGYGIDLGGTTVKLAFFDQEGTMLSQWEIPTDKSNQGANILPDIAAEIKSHRVQENLTADKLIGIGIGVPGPVDDQGVVNKCVNLGWGVRPVASELAMLTGLPVVAGNDANVAALGESWKGGGEGCQNMVFATLGTGVGGGIVLGGKIIHGAHGGGGEIGHMVLNRDETELCGCGKRGCVEQYCSASGIVRLAKQAMAQWEGTTALAFFDPLTCKDIFDSAAQADDLAQQVLEQVYRYTGQFLADICCVVDPEVVVLGGGVSKAGAPLLEGVHKYFLEYVFHANREARFALAKLGNDAGAYGAFKMALDRFL